VAKGLWKACACPIRASGVNWASALGHGPSCGPNLCGNSLGAAQPPAGPRLWRLWCAARARVDLPGPIVRTPWQRVESSRPYLQRSIQHAWQVEPGATGRKSPGQRASRYDDVALGRTVDYCGAEDFTVVPSSMAGRCRLSACAHRTRSLRLRRQVPDQPDYPVHTPMRADRRAGSELVVS